MKNIISTAIEKRKYEILRKDAISRITGNLGKVVETDKEFICYINPRKIEQDRYDVSLSIPEFQNQHKQLLETYKIDKPIRYVLNNFKTKKNVYVVNYNDKNALDIINCCFGRFSLKSLGKCCISDTNISAYGMLNLISSDLTINNLNVLASFSDINVLIAGDAKLNVSGLAIYRTYDRFIKACIESLNLYSEGTIQLNKTDLVAKFVEIEAKKVVSDTDTIISSLTSINIKNNEEIDNLRFKCYKMSYNGFPINDGNMPIDITLTPLLLRRFELIEALKRVYGKTYNDNIQPLIDIYRNDLEGNQKVLKLIRRRR